MVQKWGSLWCKELKILWRQLIENTYKTFKLRISKRKKISIDCNIEPRREHICHWLNFDKISLYFLLSILLHMRYIDKLSKDVKSHEIAKSENKLKQNNN